MGKTVSDTILDGALNLIKKQVLMMTACTEEPTTYASAHSLNMLARVVMASGDFTVGDGDTNGRKVAVAQKTGVPISVTGTANHVCLLNTSASTLEYVTTATAQALTSGNTLTFNGWDVEIADPS